MDPRKEAVLLGLDSFPRTRGDGPEVRDKVEAADEFPPHTRGWTVGPRRDPGRLDVSPAHAGMDPVRGALRGGRGRFPRTRGDGPDHDVDLAYVPTFPPHTRGWTPAHPPGRATPAVSPAHAGMDPRRRSATPRRLRFPRTRGDGPRARRASRRTWAFPPHTRGWTADGKIVAEFKLVSPAHAGMDPPPSCR